MSFTFELLRQGHPHRVRVASLAYGWEVVVEQNSTVIERRHREDWHRVERDIRLFRLRAFACDGHGWPVECRESVA